MCGSGIGVSAATVVLRAVPFDPLMRLPASLFEEVLCETLVLET